MPAGALLVIRGVGEPASGIERLSCGVYENDGILVALRAPLSTAATELAGMAGARVLDD